MARPEHEDSPLTFYPAFTFKASHTHFTWVKMSAIDIHQLRKRKEFDGTLIPVLPIILPICCMLTNKRIHTGQGIFFYNNHPIRFVSLLGIIVARTEVPRRTILTLDDSSGGCVDVVVLKKSVPTKPGTGTGPGTGDGDRSGAEPIHQSTTANTPLDISDLHPQTVVKVKGTLSVFRGTVQIQLERYFTVRDTNTEMRFLDQRVRFLVEVLASPWVLSSEEVEVLKDEREEEEVRVDGERRRAEKRRRKMVDREEKDRRKIMKKWEMEERLREVEAGACRREGRRLMGLLG